MKTYQWMDKSEWPVGEWSSEPDKAQWISDGLDCLIVRNMSGALCGYVGVPETDTRFGMDYYSVDVDVHGGLTFADRCSPHPDGDHKGICHVEEGAAHKTVWWFGFDCAHCYDLLPACSGKYTAEHDVYRRFGYVKQQVEKLASQLAAGS